MQVIAELLVRKIYDLETNSRTLFISAITVIQLYADHLLISSSSSNFSHLPQSVAQETS